MKYYVERDRRVLRGLSLKKLSEVLDSKPKEKEREAPEVTYWMELGLLTQDILDDVASIYCQVFKVDTEDLDTVPNLTHVQGVIASDFGFYETRPAGSHNPALEIRRIMVDGANLDSILIRFKSTRHPQKDDFQKAVDGYLGEDCLHLAKPLSKVYGIRHDKV